MSAAANSATSPLPSATDVEVDVEPDEEVPRHDDEDEILFPELVDRVSQQAVEGEYEEEPSSHARFDDTDDEEREENIDSLVLQEYDGEDMPTIEWNRENPDLTPGTVFESMVDCRFMFSFQIVKKFTHFEWVDDYVKRIQLNGAPTRELNLPSAATNLVSESAALTVGDADLKGEIKKMNKNLKQMIQLNKQANLIVLGFYPFYFCVVALGFAYLLVITR
ncbi:hypothetical protein D1007_07981 [Hordeum vulgare]|nr:hypothetical protein D1007_07981 [Hordeum vulgare]